MIFFNKKYIIWFILLGTLSIAASLQSFGIPVLNYHIVSSQKINALAITPQEFEEQMAYLYKQGFTTITPDQLLDYLQYDKSLPPKPVLITFDDGYSDTYREAYPILKKYNFVATVFLITDYIGNNSRYLTWDQVKTMHTSGFSFGSHTLNHISLSDATNEYAQYQLNKSRKAIEWNLNAPVKYFAYPGGFYNQKTAQLLQQTGYRAAFTVNFGTDNKSNNVYALNRIPIFQSANTFRSFWLRLKFTQLYTDFNSLRRWLNRENKNNFSLHMKF